MNRKGIPAELVNELFGSLPLENAFGLLAKMSNGLLARNIQKMINCIKEAMKNNKLCLKECGPKLTISDDGFIVKYSGPEFRHNCVRAFLSIPSFNLKGINKPKIAFYFEMQILSKLEWNDDICIGFCQQQFPLEGEWLGGLNNSIGIEDKRGIWIDEKWTTFGKANNDFNKGDYIGIGLIQQPNFSLETFGTINGKLLGKAKLQPKFSQLELFPSVSLRDDGDSICVHFEKDKWIFKQFKRILE